MVVERLDTALNAHDLDAFLDCFGEDYESEQPVHPERGFGGREQVRSNWSAIFAGVPDFHADLLRASADRDTEWSEWRWRGTRSDGAPLDMAGVMVCGVRDDRIRWARLYIEPVEAGGARIDEVVERMVGDD
jgi:ketosteroid isomerase-like protein